MKHEAEASPSNREMATRIVQAKGWDAALVKPIMDCIKMRRLAPARVTDRRGYGGRSSSSISLL
jgi:hypothetical protein